MNNLLEQRFFRLLSEYSLRKVSASESTEAIEELATHLADFSINEQDYSILLRYFSFGLHHLKSEVCEILEISKRALQTYRDHGVLSFSRVGHKTYYRPQDVERVINNLKQKSDE